MIVKIRLLIDILKNITNDKCFYKGTDYLGLFDEIYLNFCNDLNLIFEYKKYQTLYVPLDNENREKFILFLEILNKKTNNIIFQENHIICKDEKILESFDNFSIVFISNLLKINIERYKKYGINIHHKK